MWEIFKPQKRTARMVADMLREAELSIEDRQLLTTVLIERLGALPVRARITVDESGQVFVDGKQVTVETAKRLHETSKTMLNNFARRFVRETVTFMAVKQGVHDNLSPEQGLFAKAALWFFQEEDELYRKFAGAEPEEVEQERTL